MPSIEDIYNLLELQYLNMKNSNKLVIAVFCLAILANVVAQDDIEKVQEVFIGKKKTFQLTGATPFVGHYSLQISESELPKDQQKWYLFAMAQPKEKSKQFLGSPTKIEIKKNGEIIKNCQIVEESDSCFIKNDEFDYKKDKLKISVHCQEQCQFQFITEIDYAFPLKLNKQFKLNFEDTAYSKIFTLDTTGEQFYELRILLEPRGFIAYGEPVILLANYGKEVPTQSKHDFKGIHIWDDGQGIFIRKSELKQRELTILVEGPQKNVLNLIAEGWQKEEKLQLNQYWPEFDWIKAGESRQSVCEIKQTSLTHIIKVVIFSGYLQVPQLFKVEEGISEKLTPISISTPNNKYGEFQFRLSKELIDSMKLKKVSIKLTARKETTYIINFAREESALSVIVPYVSESSIMMPNQIDQYYVKVEELIESTKQKKTSKIEIILGNIDGIIKPTFYKCKAPYSVGSAENLKNCEVTATNKKDFIEATPLRFENRGSQQRYWFEISWEDYVKKTDKDKAQVIYQLVIYVENTNKNKTSSYEIQYKNKDRIYLLKEGELTKDRVFINEKRHYKLSVHDADATQVRIHCTRISGEAFFIGSFVDPRVNKDHEKILPLYSIITFKIDPQKKINEVFLEVEGVDNAYYSITTQIIRKSETFPSKKNNTGYNELIVREEIPYQFLIAPLDSIVLQLHASSKNMKLNLKSNLAVKVCMTENLSSPPFAPNCEISNDFFLDMNEEIILDKGLIGNIGIKNTNTQKNASIKIYISSADKKKPTDGDDSSSPKQNCESAAMNEVMFERLGSKGQDKQGLTVHCIEFNLNKYEEVELIVDVRGDHFYDKGTITASINGQQTVRILSPSHIFSKEEVEASCLVNKKAETQTFCYLKVKVQGIENVRVRVLAQYTNDAIRLIDGIAHPVHSQISKSEPKHFYTAVHNSEDFTVFLENKVGQYKVYAKLMPYSQFSKKRDASIYPTKDNKDLESSNPFYYLEQILVIPKEKISQKCPQSSSHPIIGRKWLDCSLLLTVVLEGSAQFIQNGKFVIEATQQNRELRENVPLTGYLQKKSTAFYNYHNELENGTILVTVNNQNKNCLDIFLRKGSERATAQYNDKHAKSSNTLMYSEASVGTYSITLQASQNCPYTIIASAGKNKIRKIKKGTFADINLALNQQTNLLFENHMNETFKILSLHKTGEVIISVNPIPREKLQETLTKDISKVTEWKWSNKDSVRINNLNKKNEAAPDFCVDCYYLININAQRPTQASLVIPTPDSELPITTDSMIKDLLQKQETVTYRVFTQSSSQFEVYVQYGKIQITIVENDKDIVSFNKTFEASKAPSLQTFNLTKTETYEFLRYIKINIRASEDTYFSFSIVSSADPTKRGPGLKYGLPEYIYLDSNKEKCMAGTMTASIDEFLLSFSKADKKTIEEVDIRLKINEKQVSIDKESGNNEMLLRVNSLLGTEGSQGKKFEICFKSKAPVSITLIQSSPLNYWPEKESIIVRKQANLTFGAEGKTIIEINECKSRASAEIFSEFHSMKSTSSQVRQRRKGNNIVQFYHYGPVYIKIASEKSTLRWISVNETGGAGLGYDQFRSSWIRVLKTDDNIEASADPIKPVNQKGSKSQLVSVTYNFFAAKEQMELYNAMNCGQGEFATATVTVDLKTNPEKGKEQVKALFNIKSQLRPKFQNFPYFLIGLKALVTLKTSEGQVENYRFFYPYQQVSKQTILYGKVNPIVPEPEEKQEIDNSNSDGAIYFIGYALVALIVITAAYWAYVKYCKKCLKKKARDDESMGREMKYFDLSNTN